MVGHAPCGPLIQSFRKFVENEANQATRITYFSDVHSPSLETNPVALIRGQASVDRRQTQADLAGIIQSNPEDVNVSLEDPSALGGGTLDVRGKDQNLGSFRTSCTVLPISPRLSRAGDGLQDAAGLSKSR